MRSTTASRGHVPKGIERDAAGRAVRRQQGGPVHAAQHGAVVIPRLRRGAAAAHPRFEAFNPDGIPNRVVEAEVVVGIVGMLVASWAVAPQKRRITRRLSSRNSGRVMCWLRSRKCTSAQS